MDINSHEQFMITYFNILAFGIFCQILTFSYLHNNQIQVFHTILAELTDLSHWEKLEWTLIGAALYDV